MNRSYIVCCLPLVFSLLAHASGLAQPTNRADEIKYWLDNEFQPSTLTPLQQSAELEWFINAAQAYQGLTIRVVSEDIATHRYESNTLAKAFSQLTGIHVIHEITQEDDVVNKLQLQNETQLHLYDAYVNDSDFIGTHSRQNKVIPISHYLEGPWKDLTLPTLDLADFIGLPFTVGVDGEWYQLPTQQFANLYWYRHDLFSRPELQKAFKETYGYALGIPQNWQAYEDIAAFFSQQVKYLDGERIWGHMDYGHYDPSLGWRISDSWLNLAGVNDTTENKTKHKSERGYVGDWGIRVKDCQPVGASMSRGGALDSPAAIYAVQTYIDWLKKYAPPEAQDMTFSSSSSYLAKGNIAQQVFWYTAFIPMLLDSDKLRDEAGLPLWRVAPSPVGKYWRPGMKSGYQDVGGWTFPKTLTPKQSQAAWLYAQFTVSKTVSMKKFLIGYTPIRHSDIHSPTLSQQAGKWGGLLAFYQSEAHKQWTPTGLSVPDYPNLSKLWWQQIGLALQEKQSVKQSMQSLATKFDQHMQTLESQQELHCAPLLNQSQSSDNWLSHTHAPWLSPPADNRIMTLPYAEAILRWEKR